MVVRGVHGCGGCAWCPGGMRGVRRDTVNERAVRILLECILACNYNTEAHQKEDHFSDTQISDALKIYVTSIYNAPCFILFFSRMEK